MTIVDLDFEEELKETEFPDLLEGVCSAPYVAEPKKKSKKKKHKKKSKATNEEQKQQPHQQEWTIHKVVQVAKEANEPVATTSKASKPGGDHDPATTRGSDPPEITKSNSEKNEGELLDSLLHDDDDIGGCKSNGTIQAFDLVPSEDLYNDDNGSLSHQNVDDALRATSGEFDEDYELSRVERLRSVKSSSPETAQTPALRANHMRDFIQEIGGYGEVRQELGMSDDVFRGNFKSNKHCVVSTKVEAAHDDTSATFQSDESHDNGQIEIEELQIVNEGYRAQHSKQDADSSVSSVKAIADDGQDTPEDDDVDDGTNENNSAYSSVSEDAAALLERAHDRIARQKLQEEVQTLKEVIERKNAELENLAGQLRRAVETKCDLVVAHNELAKHHEQMIQKKNDNLMRMKEANKCLLEGHAATEKKMLNELIRSNDRFAALQKKHDDELDDWERLHRNEMLEKDYQIAKLTEELRSKKLGTTGFPQLSSV